MHTVRNYLYCRQQPLQARKDWDVFTNNPPIIVTGSMAQHTCIDVSLQIIKVLAYICTFLFVLGGAVLSKGTLLFMTSQLDNTRSVETCDDAIDGNYEHFLPTLYFFKTAWT